MTEDAFTGFAAVITSATPLGRTGTPDEIAAAVAFLQAPTRATWRAPIP
jgi:NAD(P)-dependent dehydrogenase (short-subunit alcohol dehydrogenase family)